MLAQFKPRAAIDTATITHFIVHSTQHTHSSSSRAEQAGSAWTDLLAVIQLAV
jgi:hypothetical protein